MTDDEIRRRIASHRDIAQLARQNEVDTVSVRRGWDVRYRKIAENEEAAAAALERELDRRAKLPWWRRIWL